jgi:hypothetical protein
MQTLSYPFPIASVASVCLCGPRLLEEAIYLPFHLPSRFCSCPNSPFTIVCESKERCQSPSGSAMVGSIAAGNGPLA